MLSLDNRRRQCLQTRRAQHLHQRHREIALEEEVGLAEALANTCELVVVEVAAEAEADVEAVGVAREELEGECEGEGECGCECVAVATADEW